MILGIICCSGPPVLAWGFNVRVMGKPLAPQASETTDAEYASQQQAKLNRRRPRLDSPAHPQLVPRSASSGHGTAATTRARTRAGRPGYVPVGFGLHEGRCCYALFSLS
eukprot:5761097-Prymnesium_polylepis.1